jgi:hypothetical protein
MPIVCDGIVSNSARGELLPITTPLGCEPALRRDSDFLIPTWKMTCHFFVPAAQSRTTVMEAGASLSVVTLTRKRPSTATS